MLALRHQVALHPRGNLLRRRRDRRLGAMFADRANATWYGAALVQMVGTLRWHGADAARALKNHWPVHIAPPPAGDRARAFDSNPPKIRHEVNKARARAKEDTHGLAPVIATRAIRKNLGAVDDKLAAKIKVSLGIEVRQQFTESHPLVYQAMRDALAENVDLITSVQDDYMDDVEEVLADNWQNGGSWTDAVEAVEHVGDVTESRAELIARDQTLKLNAAFNRVRQQSIGVQRYEWVTVGDDRVREAHQELEGTVHDWDDPPTDSDGNTGHAGECGIQDRCATNPILDLDEPDDEDQPDGGEEEPDEDEDEVEGD